MLKAAWMAMPGGGAEIGGRSAALQAADRCNIWVSQNLSSNQRLTGTGPEEGWVSIKISGKDSCFFPKQCGHTVGFLR